MINILQGSVVTQTVLGGSTIYPLVVNFPWAYCICAKSYESWLAVDKLIAMIINRVLFLRHPVYKPI